MTEQKQFALLSPPVVGGEKGKSVGGPGGIRTHVRTRKPCAFYMLIPVFIFVMLQDPDHQQHPYPLKLHRDIGACLDYFRFYCAACPSDSEQHPWSDVSFPHLVKK